MKIDHIILGLFSYLWGLLLDLFQTMKRHSYDGYSIYMLNFNSFLKQFHNMQTT